MRYMTSLLLMSACPHLSLICSNQLIGRVSRGQMLSLRTSLLILSAVVQGVRCAKQLGS